MKSLVGKNIVLGVTGGIAAYKAVDVVSRLKKKGANVHVIMTKNATKFVSPLTFRSLSQNEVIDKMFSEPVKWDTKHISLAKKADIFAVVPATANVIGKIANGIADDMLTTTLMATKAEVLIAPAMNTGMYTNAFYKKNENALKEAGYRFVTPESGRLACGDIGEGKLSAPKTIVDSIEHYVLKSNVLDGKKVLITAGPTQEKIDPVRYITNHSTGKMGYAVAKVAARLGAQVQLVSGPTTLSCPIGVKRIEVTTADEMYRATMQYKTADIAIMTAAVSDYKPKIAHSDKIKKSDDALVMELSRNRDILYNFGMEKQANQILVGFAAETKNVDAYALKKLEKKNLDMIVANDVSDTTIGFKSNDNKVTIYSKHEEPESSDVLSKEEIAEIILKKVVKLLR